ncbi:hypothetical protein D3C71_1816930 [compost metagenome]
MTGIDTLGFIVVAVVMVVIFTLLELEHLLATPSAPQHPERNQDNQCSGCQLEIRLGGLSIQPLAQVHTANSDQPDYCRMRQRCGQAQQHRLFDRATNGHDKRRHHGF